MENAPKLTDAIANNDLEKNDNNNKDSSDQDARESSNNNNITSSTTDTVKQSRDKQTSDLNETSSADANHQISLTSASADDEKVINSQAESTPPSDDGIDDASTEVNLDISVSSRLEGIKLTDDVTSSEGSPVRQPSTICPDNESVSDRAAPEKPAMSAELARSILAGEISDTSECSVEVEEEEASDYVEEREASNASDEEMFIQDQEEEVEEEEEFHEVEEEKLKTSQESMNGSNDTMSTPHDDVTAELKSGEVQSESHPVTKIIDGAKQSSNSNEIDSTPVVDALSSLEVETKNSTVDSVSHSSDELKKEISDNNLPNDPCIKTNDNGMTDLKSQSAKSDDWASIMSSSVRDGETPSEEQSKDDKVSPDEEKTSEDPEKKELDLDEDVKNPQYIPKKGEFYEHDDRSHDDSSKKQSSGILKKDEESSDLKEFPGAKKACSSEGSKGDQRRGGRRQRTEGDRWNHDLFRDERQKPKSKSELINAYGYDIRQGRTPRNQVENRSSRGNNTNNSERQQGSQDNQRSRQNRDNRGSRQNPPSNRSRDRRPRRQNNRNRTDSSGAPVRREAPNSRPNKTDSRDSKHDTTDGKQLAPQNLPASHPTNQSTRREQDSSREKSRNENRARRQNSNDRPSNLADDKLPPINTVMPPITTWSNKIEDMVKEEASHKESPSKHQQVNLQTVGVTKTRSNEFWPQSNTNKAVFYERSGRNNDEMRHQGQTQNLNARRYQDREDNHKLNRNHQYGERLNQHHQEWRRTNHYNSYAKSNEYEPIKTQTFENSRLSQSSMNRTNFRDARELINERRTLNQQNFNQPKVQPGSSGSEQQQLHQRQMQHQQQQLVQQQHNQQQILHHQQLAQQHQQVPQHLRHQQQSSPPQQQLSSHSQHPQQPSKTPLLPNQQLHGQRQALPSSQPLQSQQRQNLVINNSVDGANDSTRLSVSTSNANDLMSSRAIIKTDTYTGPNVPPHSQQAQSLQQHSQNHNSLAGPMSQQGPSSAGPHLVPSHLSSGGTQAQYYTPSNNARDSAAAAAALATAYHGYIPSGHSVMDTTRYHMTSQQISDHAYMTSPGQTNDVAAASVLHQQGMYPDAASAGGTVASSAYMTQAGSNLSPSANIPVTGAGPPPLASVSYLQHSQYAPPPYSNPYSQPQHNQAPPQSSHAYPYWTYI